ncbi:MAG TPA: type II 3-dehydroquinate dehydratase [Myxococcales bacterium]|jgi:3-dehydroquinate dehydratase-2|nr:type II 3-dehydroquinate dehydratase [Myxococcales bacterium]
MNILVIHGPNLNLLGEREGDEKGRTLDELNHQLQALAERAGIDLRIFQSNHEGALIDRIHAERRWADGILINPGALTHSSYVLRDALAAVSKPALEVHLTDIRRRESWRRKSVIKDVCAAQVMGKGFDSYLIALQRFADGDLTGRKRRRGGKAAAPAPAPAAPARASKSSAAARAPEPPPPAPAAARGEKTIGRGPPAGAAMIKGDSREKTIGVAEPRQARAGRNQVVAAGFISRSMVRQKIADRLAGKLTAAGLATWARAQFLEVQRGAPAESGHRELLEDSLQSLTLSAMPATKLSDEQLVDLMAQLEG